MLSFLLSTLLASTINAQNYGSERLHVARAGKQNHIIAQYYPAYNSFFQPPAKLDWNYIDILYYFDFPTAPDGIGANDGGDDELIKTLVTDAHTNKKKILFTIGGWTGSRYFSALTNNTASRTSFANQIADMITKHGFDGVDLDWEYLNSEGIGCNSPQANDTANFLAFLNQLRTVLDGLHGDKKLLTIAVGLDGLADENGDPVKDLSPFAAPLDYVTLMNYDVYWAGAPITGPNSPLSQEGCSDLPDATSESATQAVKLWTDAGFPAKKLLLGTPGYARSWTANSKTPVLYQAVKPGAFPHGDQLDSNGGLDVCGNATTPDGIILVKNLIQSWKILSSDEKKGLNGYTRYWSSCTSTPYLFNPNNQTIISYEDSKSTSIKAQFVVEKGMAGMAWFDSEGPTTSMLKAARSALSGSKTSSGCN
ncbi:glycoside hydrolase family 18 protein [Atractiella rhizophila]|nr:glycoside hydrolase family 18 protein [Atractiella rhizophila]